MSGIGLAMAVGAVTPAEGQGRCAGRRPLAPLVLRTARRIGLQVAFNPGRLAAFCTTERLPDNATLADLRRVVAAAGLRLVQIDRHLFALALAVPPPAPARARATSPHRPPTATAAAPDYADDTIEPIVVMGRLNGADSDRWLRRLRTGIGDSVSADRIRQLPAVSAADALRLVPGVQLDNQRGSGVYMFARGLDSVFHVAEIDGRAVALNELVENGGPRGRSFRFEMIPAEFIGRIDVAKTTGSAQDEAAVGVTVDMRILHPLDIGNRIEMAVRSDMNDWRGQPGGGVTGIGSWTTAGGDLGILLMAQARRRAIRNDRFFEFQWTRDRFPGILPHGTYTPGRVRPTIEIEDRHQRSGMAVVQWRPAVGHMTEASAFVTRLDVDYDESGLDIYPDDATYVTPRFVTGSAVLNGDTAIAGRIEDVRWMASRETSRNRHDLLVTGIRHSIDDGGWHVVADAGFSRAHSHQPRAMGTSRSRMAFFAPLSFDFYRGYRTPATLTTDRDLTDPASYAGWTYNYAPKDSRDTAAAARIDAERVLDDRFATTLRGGMAWQERRRDYRRRDLFIDTLRGVPVTDARLGPATYEPLPHAGFLGRLPAGTPGRWLVPSATGQRDLLLTEAALATAPGIDDLAASYAIRERVISGYGQIRTGAMLLGGPLDIEAGVRLPHTEQVSAGYRSDGIAATPVRYRRTYLSFLPSLSLRWEPAADLTLRLAAGRSVTRPNLTDIAPRLTLSLDNRTASGGNPMLRPFVATNLDMAIDYTPGAARTLSAGLFQRRLDDYITSANRPIAFPDHGSFLLSTTQNGGRATLSGAEVAGSIGWPLPAAIGGRASVNGSLTLVGVASAFRAGDRVIRDRLIGLSRTSVTLAGRYERGVLAADLGWFWRSRYLNSYGTSVIGEEYVAPLGTLDGRISVAARGALTIDIDATNLLGVHKYLYGTTTAQPKEINLFGRTVSVGIRWRMPA